MTDVSTSAETSPPDKLYHYTTAAGLYGILTQNALHATHIRYLNDSSERELGLNVILNGLINFIETFPVPKKINNQSLNEMVHYIKQYVDGHYSADYREKFSAYITSFSEKENLLSQWRAYAEGGGYSLGFSSEKLRLNADYLYESKDRKLSEQSYQIQKCLYVDSKVEDTQLKFMFKEATIYESLKAALYQLSSFPSFQELVSHPDQNDILQRKHSLAHSIVFSMYATAASIKHKDFGEEVEWRIIRHSISPQKEYDCLFKPVKNLLKPFLSINLHPNESEPHPLQEIWIGPMPDQDLAHASLEMFLKSSQFNGRYDHVDIIRSDIPYRGA